MQHTLSLETKSSAVGVSWKCSARSSWSFRSAQPCGYLFTADLVFIPSRTPLSAILNFNESRTCKAQQTRDCSSCLSAWPALKERAERRVCLWLRDTDRGSICWFFEELSFVIAKWLNSRFKQFRLNLLWTKAVLVWYKRVEWFLVKRKDRNRTESGRSPKKMKIDRSKLRKTQSEVVSCRTRISCQVSLICWDIRARRKKLCWKGTI